MYLGADRPEPPARALLPGADAPFSQALISRPSPSPDPRAAARQMILAGEPPAPGIRRPPAGSPPAALARIDRCRQEAPSCPRWMPKPGAPSPPAILRRRRPAARLSAPVPHAPPLRRRGVGVEPLVWSRCPRRIVCLPGSSAPSVGGGAVNDGRCATRPRLHQNSSSRAFPSEALISMRPIQCPD